MKFSKINGISHVSFECPHEPSLGPDKFIPLETLEGMYCFLLCQLRGSQRSTLEHVKAINKKRRRTLLNIRRALRMHENRKLPLDVVKGFRVHQRTAQLRGYTILG
ncbi:hypothetical protein ACNO5E_13510 [Vibrio parahaemolyticus]|uniref:hypothetical protein n=1 Tax=Vibrio parahaemolyticus TaxID=670 RepID=UPI000812EC3C|nr:hypothetical protein [Vibrio parahaemolyticus]OCP68227.1 hypothetical protein AKH08_15530 [Vibrio parahaemolyticus]